MAQKVARLARYADQSILVWENQTDWQLIDGIWVPVRHVRFESLAPTGTKETTWVWQLQWAKVNKPLHDDLFTHVSIKIPDRVGVFDVAEGRWIREPLSPLSFLPTGTGLPWIVVGVLLLVSTLVIWAWHVLRKRRLSGAS